MARSSGPSAILARLAPLLLLASLLAPVPVNAVQFQPLAELATGIGFTTVIELGPEDPDPSATGDGCLYAVNGGAGAVHRICFEDAPGGTAKQVTSTTVGGTPVIDLNGGGGTNNVLGITVDPAAPSGEIHLYLGYSDDNSAPFAGKIARAVSTDSGQSYVVDEDFITGLARSAFDHQTNGLDFGPDGCLYITQGNNSNAGYDSAFAESFYSSAILRVCFKTPSGAVDPSVDRDCGSGNLQEACDVEIYASGQRNPFDLVWHSNGSLYATDNDVNPGFRDDCGNEANNFGCACQEPAVSPLGDELNRILPDRYYGSPNPSLAFPTTLQCQGGSDAGDACLVDTDCAGGTCADLGANCPNPLLCGDPVHCFYFGDGEPPQPGEDPNGLYMPPLDQSVASTLDGIAEYRSQYAPANEGSFCSTWNTNLLVTAGPGALRRYSLSPDGLAATHEGTANLNGATGLDVVVHLDGTVFVADLNAGKVTYLQPIENTSTASADFFVACGPQETCQGTTCVPIAPGCANPPPGDSDCDGLANAADPCIADARNLCAGAVATCETAPPGAPDECSAGIPLRLDVGATAPQTDCNGDVWNAEGPAANGTNFGGNVTAPSGPLALAFGCTPNGDGTATLVTSEKFANPLQRSYPIANGSYVVNLLFAEAFDGVCNGTAGGAGQAIGNRTMDVFLEGVQVEGGPLARDGFDQYATSLAQNGATDACGGLVVRSYEVSVSDGALDLQLTEDDAAFGDGNAALKAIEVVRVQECVENADCDDALACTSDVCDASGICSNTPLPDGGACDDGDPNTSNDMCQAGACTGDAPDPDNDGLSALDPCPGDPRNLCFAPVAVDATSGNPIRLNANVSSAECTGPKTDCNGDVWLADFGHNQAASSSTCNLGGGGEGCVISGIPAIFGCQDAAEQPDPTLGDGDTEDLFQCEHWDAAEDPELLYDFAVPDGEYIVNLYFANAFTGTQTVGSRVFDIAVEGQVAYGSFDQVVAAGGSGIAVVRSVRASVADGNGLQIEFGHAVENPAVKAIEVLGPGAGGCTIDAQCDDLNACTLDVCNAGSCVNDPAPLQGQACDDGVSCTFGDACNAGVCDPGIPDDQQCDDGNLCTTDQCDIVLDCQSTPVGDGAVCDDGVACTAADQCVAGLCGGTPDCPTGETCDLGTGLCEVPPEPGVAFVAVTPTAGIGGSTFDAGSFSVQNLSGAGGPTIDLVRLDLSTGVLPDIVFDPDDGTPAGDATSKCLEADGGVAETGYQAPADPCVDPFTFPRDNGYDVVSLFFAPGAFEPGETFSFSLDVDPTSIQGAGGAGGAGSVSGLEITAATVTVKFSDGQTYVNSLYRTPGSDGGSQNVLAAGAPAAPSIQVLGLGAVPATVDDPQQTVRVSGPVGTDVRLLVVEGTLDNGLFDLDPFEANTAVAVQELFGTVGASGFVDIPITLTGPDGSLHHLAAVIEDASVTGPAPDDDARTSPTSSVVRLQLDTSVASGTVLFRVNAGGPLVSATDGGPGWAEDSTGSPSPFHNAGSNTAAFAVSTADASVPGTAPIALFQSERWDPPEDPEMTWSFPVGTPGVYEVRLYLANGCDCTQNAGDRIFGVAIEGTPVLGPYDIVADVGHLVGTMKSFLVASDASLDIDFTHATENPLVNAIEILTVDADGFLSASPGTIDFGLTEIATSAPPQSVVIENLGGAGDQTITITNATVIGEFGTDLAVPQVLAPGGQLSVEVSFAPTAVGPAAGTLILEHDGNNSPTTVELSGEGFDPSAVPISFEQSLLNGESVGNPTSLDFGPDGRLYVSQQDGTLLAYTIVRNGPQNYGVTATETILLVKNTPNHSDLGALDPGQTNRQVTGLLATGTSSNPVLYVTSSDPRIGAGGGGNDLNLDTNSGVLSRLTWTGSAWDKVDLVRGLPRSEENHATNGMAWDSASNTLFVASGGHDNKGAPSNNFAATPEYALSGAVLSVDLDAIEALPIQVDGQGVQYVYDIPTLDDPTRPGNPDAGDPFGGNDGRNQARIVPGGPVQVHAPGFRNPYDVVFTQAGRLYTFDNGPNTGWGGIPIGEGENNSCTNELNENGSTGYGDGLHFITGPGYYGGHPNPTRGNPEDSDLVVYENQGGGWVEVDRYDWEVDFAAAPPVPFGTGDPRQCDYLIPGVENAALAVIDSSTNGIAEYTASNFGSAMLGDLLAAAFDGSIYRFQLNAAGDTVVDQESLFSGFGSTPLDVIAQGDGDPFPGTIWVAVFGANSIAVFEPIDFTTCTGADDPLLDEDGDGFDNADEIANGTDPCSGGSKPPDADGDGESDLLDTDDDNDGLADAVDPFAIDPANGLATPLPVVYELFNADPGFGFFGLGFTGLMANGTTDYLDQFDETQLAAGGAGGLLTVEQVTEGDAYQANDTQQNAFQFGVNVDTTSPVFSVQTRVNSPFFAVGGSPATPIDFQSFGMFIGTGSQDDYLKLVVTANGGAGGVEVLLEDGGVASGNTYGAAAIGGDVLAAIFVDLYLTVDPANGTAQPAVSLDGGPIVPLGAPLALPAGWLDGTDAQGLAIGVISTSFGSGTPFSATWDFLKVTPGPAGVECLVAADCDDGNACTSDVCDLAGQCLYDPEPSGTTCELDSDLCTADQCNGSGACGNVGTVTCPQGEICNPGTGVCGLPQSDLDNDGLIGSDPCPTDPRNQCFGPVAVDGSTGTPIRINAGPTGTCAGQQVDCNGDTWYADFGFNQGNGFECGLPNGCPIAGLDAIFGASCGADAGTVNLFQCERWDPVDPPELAYSFDLPNGQYLVNVYFANIFDGTAAEGSRTFDIVVEGVAAYEGFDQVLAGGGSQVAVVRSIVADVVDGNGLQIGFAHLVENPSVKAIEVLEPFVPCVLDTDCDDQNECTTDVCGGGGVCTNAPVLDGTSCSDGLSCTDGDVCAAGTCGGLDNCPAGEFCDDQSGVCAVSQSEALVAITPNEGIDATTFGGDAFQITNDSVSASITKVVIDLGTAIFPDVVFDPTDGTPAGDAGSSCITPNTGAAATGYVVPADPCATPYSVPNEDGYDVLTLDFTGFGPGEFFGFNADVDPTSIQGGTGTGAAGAVSGLEATGATVTVHFDDGSVWTGETFQVPGSQGGSQVAVKAGGPLAPGLVALGHAVTPTTVSVASQTLRVTAPVGSSVRLLQVEGVRELFQAPGFDVEPFEANQAVVVQSFTGLVGAGGFVDFPVVLSQSAPGTDVVDTGLNHFVAVIEDADGSGRTGPNSDVVVLRLDTAAVACNTCSDALFCNGLEFCDDTNDCQTLAGSVPDCDDGVACTVDACSEAAGACENVPDDGACSDGDVCTADVCDELLGCTNPPLPVGTSCSGDADLCTLEACDAAGLCVAQGAVDCEPGLVCDPDTGACETPVLCSIDADCPSDGNACTFETCQGGLCADGPAPDGTTCDDGSFDTVNDACTAGVCAGELVSCTAASGILYEQTFDSDPPEWEATAAGNSPTPAPGLFQGGLVDNGDLVYGTSSTLVNIHAHVLGLNDAGNYVYQGRGKLTDLGGGIGFTILSQYPGSGQFQNVYGRWTRYAAGPAFYYEDHGFPMSCTNGGSTGFAPAANVWFEFELTAEDTGTETILTARFWTQGGARPVDPQVVCTSSAAGRLTTGTVGFWTMATGSKYLDDVQVLALDGSTPVPCDDGNACTVDSCVDDVCNFVPAADGTTCDDEIGCTAPDACAAGSCVGSDTCPGEESCNPVSGTCELLPECSNGLDDDGDTFADFPADPGCASAADLSEQDPTLPCDDGIDNDGDEKVDYPADPACKWPASEREDPECQDGLNNDGTLGIDFDGGAALDLDGDGFIDAAFNPDTPEVGEPDPQCEGKPFRNREAPNCGLGAELAFLLPALWWRRRRRRAAA